MRYIGLDVHRAWVHGAELRDGEDRLRRFRFPNQPEAWASFAVSLDQETKVCLEATGNAFWVYDTLAAHAGEVVLVSPLKMRLIAEARIKTDDLDAEVLTRCLKAGFVAPVWVPPRPIRELRLLLSHRACLVKQKVMLKNQVHAVLMRQGLRPPVTDLFGREGRTWLESVRPFLPATEEIILDAALRGLDELQGRIAEIEGELYQRAQALEQVHLLLGIPGVDVFTALVISAELGDPQRFASAKKVASYAGLCPSVHASGKTRYTGHITKAGRGLLRWALIQAAQLAVRSPGALQSFYLRLKRKKGHKIAIVATARKLLAIAWAMLVRGVSYRERREDLWREKEKRLQRLARAYRCQSSWVKPKGLTAATARPDATIEPSLDRAKPVQLQQGGEIAA